MGRTGLLGPIARLIERLEEMPLGVGIMAGSVAGIIAVRNLLELVVAQNPAYPGLAGFVHYPLAYIGPFLALTLTLSAWSGIRPLRVTRLMTLAWLLTLIPPLIDLAITRRHDTPGIGYLHADPVDLPWILLHFFDPTVALIGTTVGIRIETLLAVLLGAVYVLLRSRSWLRAVGAAASVYLVSLFFFTLPVLVHGLARVINVGWTRDDLLWHEGLLFRPAGKGAEDGVAILWLVPVVLLLLLVWRALERRAAGPGGLAWTVGRGALPGTGWLLALALAGGLSSSVLLRPPAVRLPPVPWDTMATACGLLSVLLLASVSQWRRHADTPVVVALALAGIALVAALGTTFAIGALAATAPLFLISAEPFPSWLRRLLAPPGLALCTVSAFATGWALHLGPEALARIPPPLCLPPLLAGLAFGTLAVLGSAAPRWLPPLLFAVALGLAFLLLGSLPLAGGAALAGVAAGTFGPSADRALGRDGAGAWTAALVGLVLAAGVLGAVGSEQLSGGLAREAGCVARLHVLAGQQHLREGSVASARTSYRRALECDPDDEAALRGLAAAYLEDERTLDNAITTLERLVAEHSNDGNYLNTLAAAYLRKGRAEDALPLLRRAAELHPRDWNVRYNRARALEDLGRIREAIDAWNAYVELVEGRPEHSASLREARGRARQLAIQHESGVDGP
ncbi:MAG: tetratricopeptide repeat protein [Acidobacteriota bacterium]|nr:tetratricopeptide repeat protein [Acidobacteriota bacterium]